jgi:hypothetical protein
VGIVGITMIRKGKRAHISEDGEAIIMARSLEVDKSGLRPQRTILAEKLQTEFEGKRYDVPQIEVLERKISWYRRHAETDPLEKPWRMDTLDEYPIPPEAVPSVLKVWKSRIDNGDTLTIREAKWAARLSGHLPDIEKLSYKASHYARTELMFQLLGRPFDSTEVDRSLMGLPVGISDFKSFLWLLAEERGHPEKGIKDGLEQIKDSIKEKTRGGKSQ